MGADQRLARMGVTTVEANHGPVSQPTTDPRIVSLVQQAVDCIAVDDSNALAALFDARNLSGPEDRASILGTPVTEVGDRLLHFACIVGGWKCLDFLLNLPESNILDNDTKSQETVLHLCCRFPLFGRAGVLSLSKSPDFPKCVLL